MHSGNPHRVALLPFEIFALTTCPKTFSSSAFLTPSHVTTLRFSKHFPQGNTSCSALETVTSPRLPVSADLAWSPTSTQPASLITSLRKRWKAAQQKGGATSGSAHQLCHLTPFPDLLPLWGTKGLFSLHLSPEKAAVLNLLRFRSQMASFWER